MALVRGIFSSLSGSRCDVPRLLVNWLQIGYKLVTNWSGAYLFYGEHANWLQIAAGSGLSESGELHPTLCLDSCLAFIELSLLLLRQLILCTLPSSHAALRSGGGICLWLLSMARVRQFSAVENAPLSVLSLAASSSVSENASTTVSISGFAFQSSW